MVTLFSKGQQGAGNCTHSGAEKQTSLSPLGVGDNLVECITGGIGSTTVTVAAYGIYGVQHVQIVHEECCGWVERRCFRLQCVPVNKGTLIEYFCIPAEL